MLECIILGFLNCGEMSGYQLKQQMAGSTSNFFDASFGSIYPALKKMESRGAITVRDVVEGGKFKKIYSITETGQMEFIRWLELPIECSKTRPDPLVKLFFFGYLPQKKAIQNLELYITEVEKILKDLINYEPEVKKIADLYQYSTIVFGIDHYSYIIKFCKDLIYKIKGEKQ
ncbi:MAG: PadR family transcriptional regulator [Eubacteriales bacterium]